MATFHRIRLQGPWQVQGPDTNSSSDVPSLAAEQTVMLPACWNELFGNVAGCARFRRTFHRPTNLQASDRVLVRLPDQCGRVVACMLNDALLAEIPNDPTAFDVTSQLQQFNRLEIQIAWTASQESSGTGGLWKPVQLEIYSK